MTSNEVVDKTSPKSVVSYDPHSYIFIIGDDDLNATAVGEGWEGDGSSGNPFLIEGYEISDEEVLIYLEDTRYHVKILDCNLTYSLYAIYLENVTNVVIENCIINGYNGLGLSNVTGVDVFGCDISVHPEDPTRGVEMIASYDVTLSSCEIAGLPLSDAGIYGQNCEGITLYNNTVFEFDTHGIFFIASDELEFLDNTLYWNEGGGVSPTCGLQLAFCEVVDIIGNNITENSDNGITLSGVHNATVIDNHIVDNWIHGIYVEFSDYALIQDNYIEGHGEGIIESGPACGISTYFADHIEIVGNEFWWNALNSITLGYSDYAYIANNYINHSFTHGMWIYMSHNATIEENEIYNSYGYESGPLCGVFVEWSNETSLVDNVIGYNAEMGITLLNSHDGEMIGNTIFESYSLGLYFIVASGWDISHNVIYDCGDPGIIFESPSHDNLIYYNDFGWCGSFQAGDAGTDNSWNYTGVGNWYSDYSGTGTYLIDGPAGAVDYYPSVSLYCGVTTPSEYEAGTTGNTMSWNSSALNPGNYELLINGTSQGLQTWDGSAIAADVDGLPVGVYNVTLIVYHVSGHWLADQSILTVVDTMAPTWTLTPVDQTLEYNEPLSYQLQASDPSGIASWAVNDTTNFAISSSGLLTNASALAPGVYYVEITVTDVYSHSLTVTLMITVNEPAPPFDPTMVVLAVGGAGLVVLVIIGITVLKKKQT